MFGIIISKFLLLIKVRDMGIAGKYTITTKVKAVPVSISGNRDCF
jgi:hypothetical protein